MNFIPKWLLVVSLSVFPSILSHESQELSSNQRYTLDLLSNRESYVTIAPFIDNILRQISSNVFYTFINKQLDLKKFFDDRQLYAALLGIVPNIQPNYSLYYKLKSLIHQKKILSSQAQQLLGKQTIEICTRFLNKLNNSHDF